MESYTCTYGASKRYCSRHRVTYSFTLIFRFGLPETLGLRLGKLQISANSLHVSGGAQDPHGDKTLSHGTVSVEPLVVYDCQSAVAIVDPGDGEELVALAHDGGSREG